MTLNPCPLCKKSDKLEDGKNYAGCQRCGLQVLIDEEAIDRMVQELVQQRWNRLTEGSDG